MTTNNTAITLDTLVSVSIGSDQYAGKITKVTRCTVSVVVGHDTTARIFRVDSNGVYRNGYYRLSFGESVTKLCPEF